MLSTQKGGNGATPGKAGSPTKTKQPIQKVEVTNQKGEKFSTSKDVLNDDMREVFSAGSNLA